MANIEVAGFVYDDAGAAVASATVNLYDRNTTTPVRATTTTNASGYWTISHATEGRFDVEVVSGTSKRRYKYDAAVQMQEIETANLLVRNPANTFKYDLVPAAITADRALTLPLITGADELAALALAQTFTNKRITARVNTITSSATPTPAGDTTDEFTVTAQAAAAAFAAPTGTPTDGQKLIIRIKDNATARALTWNAIYRASTDISLPITTVVSKTMYLGFIYNSTDSTWDLVAKVDGF